MAARPSHRFGLAPALCRAAAFAEALRAIRIPVFHPVASQGTINLFAWLSSKEGSMATRVENISEARRSYLPAAGHDWFLPLYDPFVKLLGGDRARKALLDQATIRPGQRVLDVGCGTGTFAVLIKGLHPSVEVVGLDPDPKALDRAMRKAKREAVSVRFDQGFSDRLPYPDASFDRVFSAFMFHHLPADEKGPTLHEVRRVLKPGGSLHLLDFVGPHEKRGLLTRLIHSRHRLADNAEERILELMMRAGFAEAKTIGHRPLFFARIAYYAAVAPPPSGG
jgi:ubiquinone/menaquinone biosynthesis C-methylase UbiE